MDNTVKARARKETLGGLKENWTFKNQKSGVNCLLFEKQSSVKERAYSLK